MLYPRCMYSAMKDRLSTGPLQLLIWKTVPRGRGHSSSITSGIATTVNVSPSGSSLRKAQQRAHLRQSPSREAPINKPRVGYLTRSHESPPCRHAVRERMSRRRPSLVRREGQVRNDPGGSSLAVSEQDRQGRARAPPAEPIQHINACEHQGASSRRNQRRYRPPLSVVPERPPAGGAGGPPGLGVSLQIKSRLA